MEFQHNFKKYFVVAACAIAGIIGLCATADLVAPAGIMPAEALAADTKTCPNTREWLEGDILYADFGSSGLWYVGHDNVWRLLTPEDPTSIVRAGPAFVAGFGSLGLWGYDGEDWVPMGSDPGNGTKTIVAAANGMVVDYGASGLWYWDGSAWTLIGSGMTECMYGNNGRLIVDYGSDWGLWQWDEGAWEQLSPLDVRNGGYAMAGFAGGFVVDFGSWGLWHYLWSTWTYVGPGNTEWMTRYSGALAVDYGAAGLWEFDGAEWSLLSAADPFNGAETMVPFYGGLAVDFGVLGLWYYDGADWIYMGPGGVEYLGNAFDQLVVADYGALGLWGWDLVWIQLSTGDADNTGGTMLDWQPG